MDTTEILDNSIITIEYNNR